jgi:hypothetical protein
MDSSFVVCNRLGIIAFSKLVISLEKESLKTSFFALTTSDHCHYRDSQHKQPEEASSPCIHAVKVTTDGSSRKVASSQRIPL